MSAMDETKLIDKYAKRLQSVYDNRTAGNASFTGILAEFQLELDRLRINDFVSKGELLKTSCHHRCSRGLHCGGCGCSGCGYSVPDPLDSAVNR